MAVAEAKAKQINMIGSSLGIKQGTDAASLLVAENYIKVRFFLQI